MGRRKLSEERKRKKICTTINSDLWELYEKYLIDNNLINKSKPIENELNKIISDSEILKILIKEGILPNKNSLLK